MNHFVDRIMQARRRTLVHLRHALTRIILTSGTRIFARVTIVVLALSFLSPTLGLNQAQAVAWSLTKAQRQAYFSDDAPRMREHAEETNDNVGYSLMSDVKCTPCPNNP